MSERILHIQSSIFGDKGVSSGIAKQLVDRLVEQTGARVTFRNLGGDDFFPTLPPARSPLSAQARLI